MEISWTFFFFTPMTSMKLCLPAGFSHRWAPHCGSSGSGPGPQHGQHRRGSAQHRRDPGGIWLPQVGQPPNRCCEAACCWTSVRSCWCESLQLLCDGLKNVNVLIQTTGARCRCPRSSSGSATWPSRSTAASSSSSPSSTGWSSSAVSPLSLQK